MISDDARSRAADDREMETQILGNLLFSLYGIIGFAVAGIALSFWIDDRPLQRVVLCCIVVLAVIARFFLMGALRLRNRSTSS